MYLFIFNYSCLSKWKINNFVTLMTNARKQIFQCTLKCLKSKHKFHQIFPNIDKVRNCYYNSDVLSKRR